MKILKWQVHPNRSHDLAKEQTTHSGGLFFCCSQDGIFTTTSGQPLRGGTGVGKRRKKDTVCPFLKRVTKRGRAARRACCPKPRDYVFGRAMKIPPPQPSAKDTKRRPLRSVGVKRKNVLTLGRMFDKMKSA